MSPFGFSVNEEDGLSVPPPALPAARKRNQSSSRNRRSYENFPLDEVNIYSYMAYSFRISRLWLIAVDLQK